MRKAWNPGVPGAYNPETSPARADGSERASPTSTVIEFEAGRAPTDSSPTDGENPGATSISEPGGADVGIGDVGEEAGAPGGPLLPDTFPTHGAGTRVDPSRTATTIEAPMTALPSDPFAILLPDPI